MKTLNSLSGVVDINLYRRLDQTRRDNFIRACEKIGESPSSLPDLGTLLNENSDKLAFVEDTYLMLQNISNLD